MKAMVYLFKGDTDFFNIVTGVLQGDTFAPYLFIICPVYILQTLIDLIKENGFMLKKDNKQMISHWNYNRCWLCR